MSRYLTTAAMALVLAAGAAGAANAAAAGVTSSPTPPDTNQPAPHGAGQGSHGGSGQGGQGSQGSHGGGGGGGGGGAAAGGAGGATAHGGGSPGGGYVGDHARTRVYVPSGGAAAAAGGSTGGGTGGHGFTGTPGAGPQGVGQGVGHGSHGGGDHHGGGDWRGGGDRHDGDRHDGDWRGGGVWTGPGGQFHGNPGAYSGNRYGGVPGADHALRGRDQGRGWFNPNRFPQTFRAEHRFHDRWDHRPRGWYEREWRFGDFLPFGWFAPDFYLDYEDYGLPYPPVGCEWVREGADAVLVNVWTGEVLSVAYGVFW